MSCTSGPAWCNSSALLLCFTLAGVSAARIKPLLSANSSNDMNHRLHLGSIVEDEPKQSNLIKFETVSFSSAISYVFRIHSSPMLYISTLGFPAFLHSFIHCPSTLPRVCFSNAVFLTLLTYRTQLCLVLNLVMHGPLSLGVVTCVHNISFFFKHELLTYSGLTANKLSAPDN